MQIFYMDESHSPAPDKAGKISGMLSQPELCAPTSHSVQPEFSRSNHPDISDGRRAKMMQLLKGKAKAWTAVAQRERPLQLLDLPMDTLKDIIKEVTHTNDLTSLSLTHSALHNLAIPHIYSRFDIVWPDAHSSSDPRNGVDALTYGLATLVMREDLFNYVVPQRGQPDGSGCVQYDCNHCGMANHFSTDSAKAASRVRQPRRGNLFSQYTRKFSLGNGPSDWVQEYLITKEGGKMLGTLVALTVARMPNLETFVWDMPTGVLRDVWYALGNRPGGQKSRLEKVWVRFHDNKEVVASADAPVPSNPNASLAVPNGTQATLPPNNGTASGTSGSGSISPIDLSYQNTECPCFSILPPLKSLTVLEVDECSYLAEMSILMKRSIDTLRELRVGVSSSYLVSFDNLEPSHLNCPEMQYLSEGGVLGLIMSKLFDCRGDSKASLAIAASDTASQQLPQRLPVLGVEDSLPVEPTTVKLPESPEVEKHADSVADALEPGSDGGSHQPSSKIVTRAAPASHSARDIPGSTPLADLQKRGESDEGYLSNATGFGASNDTFNPHEPGLDRPLKLRLKTLELEKVHISVPVLQNSIDWTILTSITLLQGSGQEHLWKFLRKAYSPKIRLPASSLPPQSSTSHSPQSQLRPSLESVSEGDYRLTLRRLHTDSVSPALISFLKETLAPNSLEWMILQDRGKTASTVTVESIYRGPLRYHRSSLKKMSIDSSSAASGGTRSSRWKRWQLSREILTFITSGKMSSIKELGMAVDYKDWHYFLQRLPNIPHLRSLYVPYIADHSYAHHLDAKELASQVVDLVIALRPEIELCYMGILKKCFEILENRDHDDSRFSSHDSRTNPAHAGPGGVDYSDEDSDGTDDDHDDAEDSDNSPTAAAGTSHDSEETESDAAADSAGDTDDEGHEHGRGKGSPKFRLREILFYDDKITIFKARHGRL